jgi:hypothetical protein
MVIFLIIDGIWQPTEVIKQFHSSNLIFLLKSILKPLVETKLGLDWAGFRPLQVANGQSAPPRDGVL